MCFWTISIHPTLPVVNKEVLHTINEVKQNTTLSEFSTNYFPLKGIPVIGK